MLPTHFVQLPELPLNKNGKVAKKKLPDPFKLSLSSDQAYVAPSNQQEELIAGAWQEILGREKIGVNDNFFELGGHSLLAMKALPKLNLKLGVKLTIKNLFVYPTIAALYKFIQEQAVQETLDPAIDLITEASEEFELDHINDLPRYAENPKDVFITGGTGFVGIYLIKELLENTKATIHCLIRGKDLADGKNRIIEKLNSFEIDNPDYHDRIVPVLGDLSAPNFGILLEDYDRLTENIDFIYHVGAYMDFMSSYYQLKAYNVTANYEIVKLATTRKLKKILYTSTIAVFKGWDLRAENDSIDHERHLVSSGYSGSKWVGEKVMLKAIEAGLPVQIYRLGLISGDAKTGKMPRDQWFSKVLKSCYELGVYIDQFAIAFTPVDFVSKSIVKLSLEDLDKAISKVSAMDWLSQLQKISETQPLPISPFVNFESQLINDAMLGKIKLSLKRKNNISSQITLKIVKKLGVTIPQRSNYIKKYLKNCL
jgi:thioester reductase-like protein